MVAEVSLMQLIMLSDYLNKAHHDILRSTHAQLKMMLTGRVHPSSKFCKLVPFWSEGESYILNHMRVHDYDLLNLRFNGSLSDL